MPVVTTNQLGTLRTEQDRVYIAGVEQFHWGAGAAEASYPGALHAALRTLGENISYEYLMGVSGLAFRTQMHRPGGCPSSPHPGCGYDCKTPMEEAIPWEVRWIDCAHDARADKEQVYAQVKASIDAGRPVVQYSEEASLIVGYAQGGARWLVREYCDKGREYKLLAAGQWPWGVALLTRRKDAPVDRKQAVLRSLRQAVAMWRTPTAGAYACGATALREWADMLEKIQPESMTDQERFGAILGNAHTFCCLYDARESAWRYLVEVAPWFDAATSAALRRAADLYKQEAADLVAGQCVVTTSPYPWMFKKDQAWTLDMRKHQAGLLRRALAQEQQAVTEIQTALDGMDKP